MAESGSLLWVINLVIVVVNINLVINLVIIVVVINLVMIFQCALPANWF